MRRKSRRRLIFRAKVLIICGTAAFMVGGGMDCYSETENSVQLEKTAQVTARTTEQIGVPAEMENQEPAVEEYHGNIKSMDWDSEDAYLLAKISMAEAEGEGVEGKALVMLVVLNRVWNDDFPDSISEVIFQKGQFSPVSNGRYDSVEPDQECYEALRLIQIEKWDESQGALYFESESESSWHRNNLQFLFQYGNHYFYK